MDEIVKLTQSIDIGTLIVMGVMLWFMYGRIDRRFDAMNRDMNQRFEQVEHRFVQMEQTLGKVQETVTDMDRRLCRLEGAFQSKDCCYLKSDSQQKTAQ
jgi:hypothetical protein